MASAGFHAVSFCDGRALAWENLSTPEENASGEAPGHHLCESWAWRSWPPRPTRAQGLTPSPVPETGSGGHRPWPAAPSGPQGPRQP